MKFKITLALAFLAGAFAALPAESAAKSIALSGTGSLYLNPGMSHGYLQTNESFTFTADPQVYSGFNGLAGFIRATAVRLPESARIRKGAKRPLTWGNGSRTASRWLADLAADDRHRRSSYRGTKLIARCFLNRVSEVRFLPGAPRNVAAQC